MCINLLKSEGKKEKLDTALKDIRESKLELVDSMHPVNQKRDRDR